MILKRIQFNNFRCFYGDQTLDLSTDREQNVTILHAQNGVGKTTILNAMLWAMFGETTPRFEQRDKLLNFEAEKEGKKTAAVEVSFEHEGSDYLLKRFFENDKPAGKNETLKIFRVIDGNYNELPAPESFISSVIPREMAGYFFFDGEHAESFSAERNRTEVSRAVRNILGCDLVETAIDDLETIRKGFDKDIGRIPGESHVLQLENKRDVLQEQIDKATEAIDEQKAAADSIRQQIEDILEKLRLAQGAKEIQKRRDTLENELQRERHRLHDAKSSIIQWTGKRAIDVVSQRITKKVETFIADERLKGRIPSPYNEDFVRELLRNKLCVCGRPLELDSQEAAAVLKLLEDAGSRVVDERLGRVRSRVGDLTSRRKEAIQPLSAANKQLSASTQAISELEQQIGECSEQLRRVPLAEIQEREEARASLEQRYSEAQRTIGQLQLSLEKANDDIREIQTEIDAARSSDQRARTLMKRRDLSRDGADFLQRLLAEEENGARGVLQSLVNGVLEKTTRKHCRAKITEEFSILLSFDDGQAMPKSGGENQLLSLAFTSALVKFASIRANAEHPILLPGTIAPLVLDAPFVQLDDEYKRETAAFVPEMAPQVILLVTREQGDDRLIDALRDRIGAEYVLIRENRGPQGDKPEDRLKLNEREYIRTLYQCERDLSRIEQIL